MTILSTDKFIMNFKAKLFKIFRSKMALYLNEYTNNSIYLYKHKSKSIGNKMEQRFEVPRRYVIVKQVIFGQTGITPVKLFDLES